MIIRRQLGEAGIRVRRGSRRPDWKVKWSWCFTLHQRDRIFQTGHSLPHRPGRTWLPLPPGHCFVLCWAHLLCWTCSLFCSVNSMDYVTAQFLIFFDLVSTPPTKWSQEMDSCPRVTLTEGLQWLSCSAEVRKCHVIMCDLCINQTTSPPPTQALPADLWGRSGGAEANELIMMGDQYLYLRIGAASSL